MSKSDEYFKIAKQYIPGGVNSPVRAFLSVDHSPIFIDKAQGAYLYDVDGRSYIDLLGSWGPMILGHNNPEILEKVLEACQKGMSYGTVTYKEVKMAEMICDMVSSIEKVRMVNSGTEAVMSALRLARAYTNRTKIIKFSGCYHGHCDSMLVSAGSAVIGLSKASSLGVTESTVGETLVAEYNSIESVKQLFEQYRDQIAAVIVEPVAANMGVIVPEMDFLQELRNMCTDNKVLLIFDEVITGFRLAAGGAQEKFGIQADLTTLGKIIGGGMPVGAFGGRKEIMDLLSPNGEVYQAGTLSGNPIAMTAGITQLELLGRDNSIYDKLELAGKKLFEGVKAIFKEVGVGYCVNYIGSLGCIFFTEEQVDNDRSAKTSNIQEYAKFFKYMLNKGIYFAPSQFEAIFLSSMHGEKEIDYILEKVREYFK